MVKLKLSCYCKFTHKIGEEYFVEVSNVNEAREAVYNYVKKECFDNWQYCGGQLYKDNKLKCIISRNGYILGLSCLGNDFYEKIPNWDDPIPKDRVNEEIFEINI